LSDKKCDREKYLFLSAYLRAKEKNLLTEEKAARLLSSAGYEEAARALCDCGYEDMSSMSVSEINAALSTRRTEIIRDIASLLPEREIADIFRIKYDYHNAKVLLKAEAMDTVRDDLLSNDGRLSAERIKEAFTQEHCTFCPDVLFKAMAEAKRVLNRSENPQLADIVLDKACFDELCTVSKKLGSKYISGYVSLLIDCANLKTAVRCMRMRKSQDFLRGALIGGGSVYTERISAAGSPEALAVLFGTTKLKTAAAKGAEAAGGGRMTDFELSCDNALMSYLRDARLVPFGEAPAVAFLAAFESELTAVRMILTGLRSGISPDTLRERLRDLYA